METSLGSMTIELYRDQAPITVGNFLRYVGDGFFEGTVFHRVIPSFMIQGGGLTPTLVEKATAEPIRNEATNGLTNDRGTIAMARTPVVEVQPPSSSSTSSTTRPSTTAAPTRAASDTPSSGA